MSESKQLAAFSNFLVISIVRALLLMVGFVKEKPSRIVAPEALFSSPDRLLPKPPLALVLKGTSVLPVKANTR